MTASSIAPQAMHVHVQSAVTWCAITSTGRRFLELSGFRPDLLVRLGGEDVPNVLGALAALEAAGGPDQGQLQEALSALASRAEMAESVICGACEHPPVCFMLAHSGTEGVAVSIGLSGATIALLGGDELLSAIAQLNSTPDEIVVGRLPDLGGSDR